MKDIIISTKTKVFFFNWYWIWWFTFSTEIFSLCWFFFNHGPVVWSSIIPMQSSISRWQSSLQTHVNNKIWNNIYCICWQTLFQPSLAWRQTKWYKIWISVNHIISHSLFHSISPLSHKQHYTLLHTKPSLNSQQPDSTWLFSEAKLQIPTNSL